MQRYTIVWKSLGALALSVSLGGCGDMTDQLKGDGSSTVFPITEAVAEEFRKVAPEVPVTIGISGTGGGFQKLIAGDTILQNASRQIKDKEAKSMREKNTEFIELPVAYDGLAIVVNPKNDWAKCLTVEELHKIWQPGSKINNWKQVRSSFPDRPLKLYGAGTDSGTFDYFTEAINGEGGATRADYTASEDDNTLVQGISRDINALGYFGLAYYEENSDKLKLVAVDGGEDCVEPNTQSVAGGTYTPLSRPLFIYVRRDAADRPEVDAFVRFYLGNVKTLAGEVGYVAIPDATMQRVRQRWEKRVPGTMYHTAADKKKSLDELLDGGA